MNKRRKKQGKLFLVIPIFILIVCAVIFIVTKTKDGTEQPVGEEATSTSLSESAESQTSMSATPSEKSIWLCNDHYSGVNGAITYEAEVSKPTSLTLNLPTVTRFDFGGNWQEAEQEFLEILGIEFPSGWEQAEYREHGYIKSGTKNQIIDFNGSSFSYATDVGHDYGVLPVSQVENHYNYTENEFSWTTRNDCAAIVQEYVRKIGLDVVVSKVYSITSDFYETKYQFELPYMEEQRKNGWLKMVFNHVDYTDDELFYLVDMKQMINGIPVYDFEKYSSTRLEYIDGVSVYATYSRNGLESLDGTYLLSVVNEGEAKQIIDFETAVNTFNDYVNNQLVNVGAVKIVYIGLEYLPDASISIHETVTLSPHWVFRALLADAPNPTNYAAVITDYFIDAVTGQVVI